MAREPLVFAEMPGLRARPYLPIANAPTPIEPIRAGALARSDRVFIKRDDRISNLYGGNKIRRFEFILPKALDEGARTIVTVGGTASTQVTATILLGRSVGLDVTAVLFDQPKTDFMREALAIDLRAGGNLVYGGGYARTARVFFQERARAFKPFVIPPGASGPLANLGYVDAMLEIAAQVEAGAMPRPDRIVVACGSGGTVAGLAVGVSWLGWSTTVVGVRITDLIASNPLTLAFLVDRTARFIEAHGGPPRERLKRAKVAMDHRFIGGGYGFSTPAAELGARAIAPVIGAPGEVTYSGKAYAALERQAHEHPGEVILFVATLSSIGRTPDRMTPPAGAPASISRLFA
jgi:D-cysteine desulfhydrase